MRWSTSDVRYLEEHAGDGAAAIAEALGRSVDSVRAQARRYGISLRRRWLCPRCGQRTFRPLSPRTGWCAWCTRARRLGELSEEVMELETERQRELEARREAQRVYARRSRAKKRQK